MRILILATYYPDMLREYARQNRALHLASYDQQQRGLCKTLFGNAQFYAMNLRALGHEVHLQIINATSLQAAWAREHGLDCGAARRWRFRLRRGWCPWIDRVPSQPFLHRVMKEQIQSFQPDLILNTALSTYSASTLRECAPPATRVMGQIASPLPAMDHLEGYDLLVSSLPNLIEHFHTQGFPAAYLPLGFESSVLNEVPQATERKGVVFVGTFSPPHSKRLAMLQHLCSHCPVALYGRWELPRGAFPQLRAAYRGPAWGRGMYEIMGAAAIVFNMHIDIAGDNANNMRLFESTGMGALLVTDAKRNLHDFFTPGREVVTYTTPQEATECIIHYLQHPQDARTIANAGQQRTLSEHTYAQRMIRLMELAHSL